MCLFACGPDSLIVIEYVQELLIFLRFILKHILCKDRECVWIYEMKTAMRTNTFMAWLLSLWVIPLLDGCSWWRRSFVAAWWAVMIRNWFRRCPPTTRAIENDKWTSNNFMKVEITSIRGNALAIECRTIISSPDSDRYDWVVESMPRPLFGTLPSLTSCTAPVTF